MNMIKIILIISFMIFFLGCSQTLREDDYLLMNATKQQQFIDWCNKNNLHIIRIDKDIDIYSIKIKLSRKDD